VAKKPRLRSGFTLGGEQAEADPLLEEAFYESSDFHVIESRRDPRCFVVGRTGSGKSAALQHLQEVHSDHVIRINPEDLSLPYITNLQRIRSLDDLNVNLDLFWIALWKHVLLVEVIRHRYAVNTPVAKQKFLETMRERFKRDPGKQAALSYLDEFAERFWCETEERVREITDKFTRKLDDVLGADLGGSVGVASGTLKAGTKSGVESTTEERFEEAGKFQRVVNDTQLGKLNKMISVLDEEILDEQHSTYVVIDDLDRDWVDDSLANDLIRCLFRTVLDLKRVKHLKVLVALRTNIFQELDFGRRSGGQEEKFRSLVLQVRWTKATLIHVLDERVKAAAPRMDLEARAVGDLLPHANKTRGDPLDYILDRTLLRPRDAIAFANECLALGVGKTGLSWDDIHTAERSYSTNRLLALRDEWKSTYPGIERLFSLFRSCPVCMGKSTYQAHLDDAMLLPSESDFPGIIWMTGMSNAMWSSGSGSWFDLYQPLANMLYSIGFAGYMTGQEAAPVFYQDDPLFMDSESNVDRITHFFVHPAYHVALGLQSIAANE